MREKQIKQIVLSNEVVVTDPCYKPREKCTSYITNMKPGKYNVSLLQDEEGLRNRMIYIWHESVSEPELSDWSYVKGAVIGVDSGIAGFIDYKHQCDIHKDERTFDEWYENICGSVSLLVDEPLTEYEIRLLDLRNKLKAKIHSDKTTELERKILANEVYGDLEYELYRRGFVSERYQICKVDYPVVATIDDKSAFSYTATGDGGYDLFEILDGNEVTALAIDFDHVLHDPDDDY